MSATTCLLLNLALLGADPAEAAAGHPAVDAVFVLDTTGSMGGLIQSAKDKIWAIANTLAGAKPSPKLRIGLVAYRDRGDDYVTKRFELSEDLDAIYKELVAFQAQGGGDSPESVNQALNEAVTKFDWSKESSTYRVIFLVGDCPPHMDYPDDVKHPETCKQAAEAGIVINTIQCGADESTTAVWTTIARAAEGKFFQVEQEGNALVAETPYDADLARLSGELDRTCVYYGTQTLRRQQSERKLAALKTADDVSAPASAQRAVFNASEAGLKNFVGSQELVADVAAGKVDLAKLKKEELPESLQKLTPGERAAEVKALADQRSLLRQQIDSLAEKRQKHLEQLAAERGKETLEAIIFQTVREQGKKAGIHYEGGPSF